MTATEKFDAWFDGKAKEFYEALYALAVGVTVEKQDEDGNSIVYQKAPNPEALKYVFNRRMGVPQERVDFTSNGKDVNVNMLQFGGGAYKIEKE